MRSLIEDPRIEVLDQTPAAHAGRFDEPAGVAEVAGDDAVAPAGGAARQHFLQRAARLHRLDGVGGAAVPPGRTVERLAVVLGGILNDSRRLSPVTRLFDLPAPEQSSKLRVRGRQSGDEVDGRGTCHPPGANGRIRALCDLFERMRASTFELGVAHTATE